MFVKAIQEVAGFTRAIHSISRTHGENQIDRGAGSLFFVNDEGYALTCKHIAELLTKADQINKRHQNFLTQGKTMNAGQKASLAKKMGILPGQLSEMRFTFVDCVDSMTNLKFFLHPEYDLALIKFEGFQKLLYSGQARFTKDDASVQQGAMLCRLGFPFPEFTNFRFNPDSQQLEWAKDGMTQSPRFPIEGMITRFLGDPKGKIYGIELSTPGLRGQSGGPLFDPDGKIVGMQSRTKHLHLGFDIEERTIVAHGKTKKVNDYAFIHLGECIHVSVIKDFLRTHQVRFLEE